MRSRELIQEALSKVVFHATTLDAAASILKSNQIKGSRDGSDYYVSFSRNRTGEYPKFMGDNLQGTSEPIVVLEFDGNMLSSKHKASPINPFYDPDDDYGIRAANFQEDRLHLGRQQFLAFRNNAVRLIHVIVNGDANTNLVSWLKSGGKVRFYKDILAFMTRKTMDKPTTKFSWSDVVDMIDQLSYTTSPAKVATLKRDLRVYISSVKDQSTYNAIGREFYSITMERKRTLEEYLDMF